MINVISEEDLMELLKDAVTIPDSITTEEEFWEWLENA